ncbi:hypothetical protein Cgig2_008272 [Carnegiea gigantea]|uniref:Leucine-rich repeat-containing N-terminal plant-type domain-containing protein n=1 Tax=Carnegiea gigantea TaxID=171969 RepID=A0A9Q1QS40_9CARY|nr:hypothetical protein Cgig2_008272 [Carnegiea gigantea]
MAFQSICLLSFIVLLSSLLPPLGATSDKQSEYFTLMKSSLSGSTLSDWHAKGQSSYCNYTGITCNIQGQVMGVNISGCSLKGSLPPNVCSYMPELRALDISNNKIQGKFPEGILNCSFLEVLDMGFNSLEGTLPNFSRLQSLRFLDLQYNLFTGDFPMSLVNLTNLEVLVMNENANFNPWELPQNIAQLTRLKTLVLSTTMLQGRILPVLGNMTSLVVLELSGNYLKGEIPRQLGKLRNLQSLMLYYNQGLTGKIPEELGNLTELSDVDLSVNLLIGKIPDSICRLPKLYALQIYNNSLTGEIPPALGDSKTLGLLSLYDNLLTGEVPQNLGNSSTMIAVDISENHLSGKLPLNICRGGKLNYFCALSNMFTGEIPESYAKCTSLVRFRISKNNLVGQVPQGIFGLPSANIIDFAFNELTGPISPAIGNAKNMSEFFAQNNRLSGVLPHEISEAHNLVKIDLSNNLLSGSIPAKLGGLKRLSLLLLKNNSFTSSIPDSLSQLKSLNDLDLSNNQFIGNIPENLSDLLPCTINLSNNRLQGPIPLPLFKESLAKSFLGNPGLCVIAYIQPSDRSFPLCSNNSKKRRPTLMLVTLLVVSVVTLLDGIVLFMKRPSLIASRERLQHYRFQEELLKGNFPIWIINLTNLKALNLNKNENFNPWELPENINQLRRLETLVLSTTMLQGCIVPSMGNMTSVVDLELSGNYLKGGIPPAREAEKSENTRSNMPSFQAPSPTALQRQPHRRNSSHFGGLKDTEHPICLPELTGNVPPDLGGHTLLYLLALSNQFTGEIPGSYCNCMSLIRFGISCNQLAGLITRGIFGLPAANIIDLAFNQSTELFAQNNEIAGFLPPEIAAAVNLVKIDLSNNILSGPLPPELGNLKKLSLLSLQGNNFTSSVPDLLSQLNSIKHLDLSNNQFDRKYPWKHIWTYHIAASLFVQVFAKRN